MCIVRHAVLATGAMSSATEQSVVRKVVKFLLSEKNVERFAAVLSKHGSVLDILAYYVCQHCARSNVIVHGYPVFAQYRSMSLLYTKAYFAILPHHSAAGTTTTVHVRGREITLGQAHFLWWLVIHDIDLDFLSQVHAMEVDMQTHKRFMSRKYRLRQKAKKESTALKHQDLVLGRTATQHAKRVRPFVCANAGVSKKKNVSVGRTGSK